MVCVGMMAVHVLHRIFKSVYRKQRGMNKIYFITNFDMLTYSKIAIDHASHLLLHKNMAL
jgi:hypothetical protein